MNLPKGHVTVIAFVRHMYGPAHHRFQLETVCKIFHAASICCGNSSRRKIEISSHGLHAMLAWWRQLLVHKWNIEKFVTDLNSLHGHRRPRRVSILFLNKVLLQAYLKRGQFLRNEVLLTKPYPASACYSITFPTRHRNMYALFCYFRNRTAIKDLPSLSLKLTPQGNRTD